MRYVGVIRADLAQAAIVLPGFFEALEVLAGAPAPIVSGWRLGVEQGRLTPIVQCALGLALGIPSGG